MDPLEVGVQVTKIDLWQDHKPVKCHPSAIPVSGLAHRGGGRGWVAKDDIPVGALIVEEGPLLTWPKNSGEMTLNTSLLQMAFSHRRSEEFLIALKEVHPVSLDHVPKEIIANLDAKHGEDIKMLSEKFPKIAHSEIQRLYLVLQMSSFGSGVYLHFSLFNHDCHPNCYKFAPNKHDPTMPITKYSQIRAIKPIKKGEELTISYLDPVEQTHEARRIALLTQFAFEPVDTPIAILKDSFVEKFLNPENTEANQAFLTSFEKKLNEFDEQQEDALQQILILSAEAEKILDPRHILLLRLNKMILICMTPHLQEEGDDGDDEKFGSYLQIYTTKAHEILKTQALWLYKDHIDLATTYNDLAMSLQSLLSWNRNLVFSAFPQWNTFTLAAKFQHSCEQNFFRIKKLYE